MTRPIIRAISRTCFLCNILHFQLHLSYIEIFFRLLHKRMQSYIICGLTGSESWDLSWVLSLKSSLFWLYIVLNAVTEVSEKRTVPIRRVEVVCFSGKLVSTHMVSRSRRSQSELVINVSLEWGKRPLGRPRLWWEDAIRMNLKETGWEYGVDSVGSE
jgi:hypothetical protein